MNGMKSEFKAVFKKARGLACLAFGAFFLVIWAASATESQSPLELKFNDLPRLIQGQNKHVRGAKSFVQAASARTGYLTRSYLPKLDLVGGYETFQTGPYSQLSQPYGAVEAKVNLFRGGRDNLEEDARTGQVALSSAEFEQSYLKELTEARRAYWNIVFQREMMGILKEAITQNERNLAAANRRIKGGISTATDRLEFEMYRIQLDQDLTRLSLEGSNLQRTLRVLLGMAEGTEVAVPAVLPHEHDDELLKTALDPSKHRDVRALSANQDIFQTRKSQAYRWWTPSLDVYGGYFLFTLRDRDYLSQTDRYDIVGGVRLTFELFDGLESKAEGASLSWQADAYENQAQQTARELQAQFETSKQALGLTHDLIHSAEVSVEKGKQYLTNTLAEYARGVKNSPDVFGATQKYVDFKRRAAELRRDYHLARADILAALGQ